MRIQKLLARRPAIACLAAATLAFASSLPASAQVSNFASNFEDADAGATDALSSDGWIVTGLVFDAFDFFKFFYGPFPAPNGGPGFSAIAGGEGGILQGQQYINTYSDYNCCGPGSSNEGHFDPLGLETVESNIMQEQTIATGDIGSIVTFTFDAKLPSPEATGALAPESEAVAFIRTLDPNANFAQTNFVTFDAQTLSDTDWSRQSVSLDLTDPLLDGQILQFGFNNRSQAFNNTGVFYDNVAFTVDAVDGDFDIDGDVDVSDALKGQRDGENLQFGDDWDANFGNGELPLSAVGAVPEPAAVSLIAMGLLAAALRRRV
ncbi:MAG: PEP-CTERM sorting domain-containing protein [Planctomycetota bacterium]